MRKSPTWIFALFIGLIIGILLMCLAVHFFPDRLSFLSSDIAAETDEPVIANEELSSLALRAAYYLKAKDYSSLSKLVHTEYGVIFSPYATVNLPSNKHFTADEIAHFGENEAKYVWGTIPATGEPIELKPSEYIDQYVMDYDYTNAAVTGFNTIVKSGSSLENVSDAFPNCKFVDLTFPGTEANEYTDWSTLRLVFEDCSGELKLTAVIHSEPTV